MQQVGPSTQTNAAGAAPATTGNSIQGTVYATGGSTPLGNVLVNVESLTVSLDAITASDGTYSVGNVPAGTYAVKFIDMGFNYLNGWYDSGVVSAHFTLTQGSATPVTVTSGNVSLLNVTMQTGHFISGTVTGTAGTPLAGIAVHASSAGYFGFVWSQANGTYSIDVPDSNSYTIEFSDLSLTYLDGYYGYWNGTYRVAVDSTLATTVPVGTSDVTGISARMLLPWTLTLGASATTVPATSAVTLTATVNQNVGPTPYFIVILASNGTEVGSASCGTGTTCTTPVTSSGPASATYHAVVGASDGTFPVITSSSVTVTWTEFGTFVPITPVRVLDTRNGIGLGGKLLANTPATFQVTGAHVPSGAIAVTGNVTVVNSSFSWAVYLGPDPVASPSTSTVNFNAGEVAGNGLTVALSGTGSLSATYISTAGNTTDLVFDVTGYFTPDMSGATYHAMSPARLLDTRFGNGLGGRLLANTPATFYVTSLNRPGSPIPASATAVTGNVTVVGSTNSWAVFLGPDPTPSPGTSTINFNAGQVRGNSLTVALGAGGTLSATYMSTAGNTTDLVFDVTGYYTADASGAVFVPMAPARLLDTRVGNGLGGKLLANTPATFQVTGRGSIPSSATAVTGNVTVVAPTFPWAVFLGPDPTPSPGTSTVNFSTGEVRGNGLTVALGGGGTLSATYMSTPGNTTDLVFDVTGYYVP